MEGGDIALFAVIVGVFVSIRVYNKVKKNKLMRSGEVTKRKTKDMTKKAEIFTIKKTSLKEIYEKLGERELAKHGISTKLQGEQIIFSAFGRMTVVLNDLGNDKYRLVVDRYSVQTTNGVKTKTHDKIEMNLVFTAVEKTMLALDPNTEIEEEFVKRV